MARAPRLAVGGIIHLLPVAGLSGANALSRLYGVDMGDANLVILMKHRAILFGILGVLMLSAVIFVQYRSFALLAGLLSAASFIAIALGQGGYSPAIRTVVVMDWIAVVALSIAALAHFSGRIG